MKRRLLTVASVLLIVGGLAYVARPAGHVPLYDANLVRLAESKLEGYCAGQTFWNSGGNPEGDAAMAGRCRAERAGTMSAKSNPVAVPRAFCRAIVDAGWESTVAECLQIMAGSQYWPTYDGGISNAWNRARPYPISALPASEAEQQDDSRTGGRVEVPRSSPQRTEGE